MKDFMEFINWNRNCIMFNRNGDWIIKGILFEVELEGFMWRRIFDGIGNEVMK